MKKIILLLLLAIIGAAGAQAQIVRSESHTITVVKKEKPGVDFGQNWLVKAGGGFMTADCGDSSFGKYSVIVGFQKQFYKNGLYWGAQLGLNSFCYDIDDDKITGSAPALSFGPTIGIKLPLGVNTTFDPHIGASYAREFASDDDGNDANRIVWEAGLGLWYKRFLIEIEYQGSYGDLTADNGVLLNFGIKF